MSSPDRKYAQYRNKPKACAWYDILPAQANQLEMAYNDISNSYDIDAANSHELDVIGRIVGIDRVYEAKIDFIPDSTFGDSSTSGGLTTFSPSGTSATSEVSNAIFRMLIKAKISRNTSDGTADSIIDSLRFITGVEDVRIIDAGAWAFSVEFNGALSELQRFVFDSFDIVPRPQAVEFLGYSELPEISTFGGTDTFGSGATFAQFFGV